MYKNFEQYLYDNATGSTFLQVTGKVLCQMPIPLPPKETQQKIVDIIESLFAKLDIVQEKVEQVLAESENRRSSILHNAFSGKLTEKWREENNVSFDTWKRCKIGDIFNLFSGKGFKESEYSNDGVKLLRISNVTYNDWLWDDVKYLPNDYTEIVPNLILEADDIVMVLNRPITNDKLKVSIVGNREKYILYQRVGCLRLIQKECNIRFALYGLQNKDFVEQVKQNLQGSDQPYINLPPLKKLEINVCKRSEQEEIVRLLDKFLSVEDKVKNTCQSTLEAIATMRKSILAKAFRGELYS